MRADMSRVIVERPRRGGIDHRGRASPLEDLPQREGVRRRHLIAGDPKELNENLAPLRRYLERQVGRPWDKVYAEIAAHLRADNTVQQHVRDHLRDFVAVKPRRRHGWHFIYPGEAKEPFSCLWYQPLYVDERDGILKRTDRLARGKGAAPRPSQPPFPAGRSRRARRGLRAAAHRRLLVRVAPRPNARSGLPSDRRAPQGAAQAAAIARVNCQPTLGRPRWRILRSPATVLAQPKASSMRLRMRCEMS